jgi:ABC-type transport system involved in multi-copper enzyme maturation permease subunit
MGKGKPLLELFTSALHDDYRFPILELFAFLYTLGTFVFVTSGYASFGPTTFSLSGYDLPKDSAAYLFTSSLLGLPLFILVILIFKNVAYGLGSDLDKGLFQTYFSYPLKRWRILTAKLLSALGVPLILFLTIQITALYLVAPDVIAPYPGTVLLTYAASLSPSLFIASIMILVALVHRRGGSTLVLGIVFFFAMNLVSTVAGFLAFATDSPLPLQIVSILSPNLVLMDYYSMRSELGITGSGLWTPAFSEVLLFIGLSYAIIAFLFLMGYYYFTRRLDL